MLLCVSLIFYVDLDCVLWTFLFHIRELLNLKAALLNLTYLWLCCWVLMVRVEKKTEKLLQNRKLAMVIVPRGIMWLKDSKMMVVKLERVTVDEGLIIHEPLSDITGFFSFLRVSLTSCLSIRLRSYLMVVRNE